MTPEPAGDVILLTGPPGAGKTTVARLLADRFSPSVHLHTDDFWHFIRQGWIAPYLTEAHQQNTVVIDVIIGAAFGYARGGYQVVVDGIVGPWFLPPLRAASRSTGVALHYLVLRPDQETTLRRATGRGETALTDPGPIRDLHRQFSDLAELERHALDTTRLTAAETVDAALSAVAERRCLLTGDDRCLGAQPVRAPGTAVPSTGPPEESR